MCDSNLHTARMVVGAAKDLCLGIIGCAGIPELSSMAIIPLIVLLYVDLTFHCRLSQLQKHTKKKKKLKNTATKFKL